MKMKLIAGVAASLALMTAVPVQAQQKAVRIGAIYLVRALASTGSKSRRPSNWPTSSTIRIRS